MKEKINGNDVEIYDSLDMPVERHHLYNLNFLIDSGIGSDLSSVLNHLASLEKFIAKEDKTNSLKELANLKQNFYFMLNFVNPKMRCFACLVKSINGKAYPDKLTEDDIDEIMEALTKVGVRMGKISEVLGTIKKKLGDEHALFFPAEANRVDVLDYYSKIKKRAILKIDIALGKDKEKELEELEEELFGAYEPKVFGGEKGVEVKTIKSFNNAALVVSKHLGMDSRKLSALEFYQALDLIKKEQKSLAKMNKK